jgi:hypothetical protein
MANYGGAALPAGPTVLAGEDGAWLSDMREARPHGATPLEDFLNSCATSSDDEDDDDTECSQRARGGSPEVPRVSSLLWCCRVFLRIPLTRSACFRVFQYVVRPAGVFRLKSQD